MKNLIVLGYLALGFAAPVNQQCQGLRNDDMNKDLQSREDNAIGLGSWGKSEQLLGGGLVVPGTSKTKMQVPIKIPGYYTVQFDAVDPGDLDVFRPVATVTFSIAGNATITRKLSCISGASISGLADHIAVEVADFSLSSGSPIPYTIQIAATKGTRPSQNQPPTYQVPFTVEYHQDLPPASTVDFNVPQNVGAISVDVNIAPNTIGQAIGEMDVLVSQWNDAGKTILLNRYNPRVVQFMPLAPGCKVISVDSSAAAPVGGTSVTVTYGIDG